MIMIYAMWETSRGQGAGGAFNLPFKLILFTRPLLWNMVGYLLSELREYMMTKETGKETMLLVMFVMMSKKPVMILKTKGGRMKEEE
jgi:hypothetical protein